MADQIITQEYLKSILNYNPKTGVFTWINPKIRKDLIGKIAASIHSDGYLTIQIMKKNCKAHRLAWLYMTGEWPKEQIDHINGDRADNSFSNLREVSNQQNQFNRKVNKNNKSGYKGVSFVKRTGKWVAQINLNNKRVSLGFFESAIEASFVYEKTASLNNGVYYRANNA